MFIGREQELNFLNSRYHSKNAELIFYMGDTALIKQKHYMNFVKTKNIFFTHVKNALIIFN